MDDSATNLTNTQSVMPPMPAAPVAQPVAPVDQPASASIPTSPVAVPSTEDLQKITQDLQNLAQEVTQTTPPTLPVTDDGTTLGVNAPPIKAKVTIYTITDCQYCKAEKEFLKSQGLEFVEKNVETNEESLKEMLSVGENFAGVPVTVLEGPTGQKVVVKGFTQTDFEEEMKKVGMQTQTTDPTSPAASLGVSPTSPVVTPAASVQPANPQNSPTVAPTPMPVASAPLPQIPNIN